MKEFKMVLSNAKRHNSIVITGLEIKRIKSYIKKCEKQITEAILLNNVDILLAEEFRNNKEIVIKALEKAIIF